MEPRLSTERWHPFVSSAKQAKDACDFQADFDRLLVLPGVRMAAVDDIVAKSSPPRPQAQRPVAQPLAASNMASQKATVAPSSGPAVTAPQVLALSNVSAANTPTESAPQAQQLQPPPAYSVLDPKSEPPTVDDVATQALYR